jgi:hypothetical protein
LTFPETSGNRIKNEKNTKAGNNNFGMISNYCFKISIPIPEENCEKDNRCNDEFRPMR